MMRSSQILPTLSTHVPAAIVAAVLLLQLGNLAHAALPPVIDLGTLEAAVGGDGSVGTVLTVIAPDERFGYSVDGVPDLDGDGRDEALLGGVGDAPCLRCAGFLVRGVEAPGPNIDVIRTALTSDGMDANVFRSADPTDTGGRSVGAVGDLNHDGLPDFAIGADRGDREGLSNRGEVYVLYGDTDDYPAVFDTLALLPENGGDGSAGFVVLGDQVDALIGNALDGGCDVNADGHDDLLIGGNAVSAVLFGRAGGLPPVVNLAELMPENGGDGSRGVMLIDEANALGQLGLSVSCLGDINADGIDDLAVGAQLTRLYATQQGATLVVFGRDDGFPPVFDLGDLLSANGGDGSRGVAFVGMHERDYAGADVANAGDFNGDGIADLALSMALSSPQGRENAGRVVVVYGRAEPFPAEFGLARLLPRNGGDGSEGLVFDSPGGEPQDESAYETELVAGVGDVNGDGLDDLLIGGFDSRPPGRPDAGATFLVYGATEFPERVIDLGQLFPQNGGDGSRGVVLLGARVEDEAGAEVAGGDFNGDGLADLLIGAPSATRAGAVGTGLAYIVFGQPSAEVLVSQEAAR